MRRLLVVALTCAAGMAMATPASASLVFDSKLQVSAQGFGTQPRTLTLQGANNNTRASGCIGNSGGTVTYGTNCTTDAQTFKGNGVTNDSDGTGDMPPPLTLDGAKYDSPLVSDLGWTSAADIGIVFNATDPSGGPITVADITLSFYNALTGALLGAIDGNQTFATSNAGNGVAGFTFVVDDEQQAYVNAILGGTALNNIRIGLGATLLGETGGPDSFTAINLRTVPLVPEPGTWAMMLLGFAGMGIAMRRNRRRSGSTIMQLA
jgi:hypothetical protein